MPGRWHVQPPDARDVANIVRALWQDHGLRTGFTVTVEGSRMLVICRTYSSLETDPVSVSFQALNYTPITALPDLNAKCYQTALDCWHQADRKAAHQGNQAVQHDYAGRVTGPGGR